MVWCTINDHIKPGVVSSAPAQQYAASLHRERLGHSCALSIHSAPATIRLTGIVCTIGPSSSSQEKLQEMMENGMNIARLNFSHSSHEEHAETIQNIRAAVDSYSKKLGTIYPLAIAVDTRGPEIRTGNLENGEVELMKGQKIKVTTDKTYQDKGNAQLLYINFLYIHTVVHPGDKIYIDDGNICLICTHSQPLLLNCVVENGGKLENRKGVNLPNGRLNLPPVTEQDKSDISFAVQQKVDLIFASFVCDITALGQIRNLLGIEGENIKVIAKIEDGQGMDNLDEIINNSDGILIGRGNLGIEIPIEKLFIAQKTIIAKCKKLKKPVICATQMLASMTVNIRPTRAESLDVANAVLDGADCVMLSGETANGKHPVECVRVINTICKEAESAIRYEQVFLDLVDRTIPPLGTIHTLAISVVLASRKCLASAIVAITSSCSLAFMISKYRPKCPIVAVSRSLVLAKQANLYRGILPLHYPCDMPIDWAEKVKKQINYGISFGKWRGFIKTGDAVLTVYKSQQDSENADTVKILYVTKQQASKGSDNLSPDKLN